MSLAPTRQGRSLELYFIDGRPDGMLTAEVFNWTGHVLMAPRTQITEALQREEAGYNALSSATAAGAVVTGRPVSPHAEDEPASALLARLLAERAATPAGARQPRQVKSDRSVCSDRSD
jgi:hypothetical protein